MSRLLVLGVIAACGTPPAQKTDPKIASPGVTPAERARTFLDAQVAAVVADTLTSHDALRTHSSRCVDLA